MILDILESVVVFVISGVILLIIDKLFWKRLILLNKDLFFDLYEDRIVSALKNEVDKYE